MCFGKRGAEFTIADLPNPAGEPMLRSMTAFASAESDTGHGTLSIELRSVNHRYLELGLRLPEEVRSLEPIVRERIAARLSR